MAVQARGRGVEAFKLNTLRRVLSKIQGHFNAAFQIHLVRVHPAQVAQVGQDGQKGLSLSEQKARRGAGQGDISDIMIQCSPQQSGCILKHLYCIFCVTHMLEMHMQGCL